MQPLASLKALADPLYEAFYGLTEQPFAITTDPKFFYRSASHDRAYSELVNGLRRHEGLMLLTGETGSGKTTLCRTVLASLGPRTFSAMVLNPYMTGPEVFRIVLRDFGLVTHDDLRRGALAKTDLPQLLDILEGFLRSLIPLDSHAVIVLDEAQSLQPVVLDQLRLLTALEQDNRRLVQIVLCGQYGLLETLQTEPLRALNERITRRVSLSPLPTFQIDAYIQHRLTVAGGAESVSFEKAAIKIIADLSHGLPRRVNMLCDRALQEGRVQGTAVITAEMAKRGARALAGVHDRRRAAPTAPVGLGETINSLREKAPRRRRLRRMVMGVGAAGVGVLVVLGYFFYARTSLAVPVALPTISETLRWRAPLPILTIGVPSYDEFEQVLADLPRPLIELPENGDELN